MATKPQSLNPSIDKKIKEALTEAIDFKERMLVLNLAVKWEAVKLKATEDDFGTHFIFDGEDEKKGEENE